MFFLLYKLTDDGVFDDFLKISDHFPKISEDFSKLFQRPDKRSRTFSDNFRKFRKMFEDSRRLSRKTRRCFDDTPTNLSTIKETNLISVKSSICSHVRISYRFYQFVELFFCKKIPLSRRVGYVMGGSVSGSVSASVSGSVSGSVRDVCMSHQSDWIYY